MTPTKEQLADPKWWDENAPEGAEVANEAMEFGKIIDGVWHYTTKRRECWVRCYDGDFTFKRYWRPFASHWSGHALPPVGTVCEACYTSPDEYYQAKVLAHDEGKAVYRWLDGPCVGDVCESDNRIFCKISGPHPKFRPLRTPEQIAEEERGRVVQAMAGVADPSDGAPETCRLFCERLYDSGFRKTDQELISALRSLTEAYRDVMGIDGAYGQEIRRAEEVLKRYE